MQKQCYCWAAAHRSTNLCCPDSRPKKEPDRDISLLNGERLIRLSEAKVLEDTHNVLQKASRTWWESLLLVRRGDCQL